MKQLSLISILILMLCVSVSAQNYHPPRAGEHLMQPEEIGPVSRPGYQMDWPWLGSLSLAISKAPWE